MFHLIVGIWKFLVKILRRLHIRVWSQQQQIRPFGQMEHRNKDEFKGEWYVQLPDGRVQHVRYYIDKYSGFVLLKKPKDIFWLNS